MDNVNYLLWEFLKLEVLIVTVTLVTGAIAGLFLSMAKKMVIGFKKKFTDGIDLARTVKDNNEHGQFLTENEEIQAKIELDKRFNEQEAKRRFNARFDEQEAKRSRRSEDEL